MSYSGVVTHGSMVLDQGRNAVYSKAIRKHVGPDSVVLDLGAGLGIHGLVAAAAGARRVYLVEPEPILRVAMEIARANGLQDRIVAIEGRIEEVQLPEQVDVIVSVMTGNLLFSEDLMPSLYFARDRYLAPGGVLIPDVARLILAPVSAPELHLSQVGQWSLPVQGLNYSPARRFASNEIAWRRRKDVGVRCLSEGRVLVELDLYQTHEANCHAMTRCLVAQGGLCHGLLGWIQLRLGDDWLSAGPEDPEVHWSSVFLPFDEPVDLREGQEVELNLIRPQGGDWTWSMRTDRDIRRQSSFLARVDGAERLRRVAPNSAARPSAQGQRALQILQWMDGNRTNQQIATMLRDADPAGYRDLSEALQAVQRIARQFAA